MIRALAIGLLAATVMSSAVVAADLIVEEPIAEVALASYDWNGAYVGAFVGGGWGDADWDTSFVDFSIPLSGWLVGGTVGANVQMDSFVLGVEGDVAWSNISGEELCPNPTFTCSSDVQWVGTLRGRAGFAADAVLLYATAGLAVGGVEHTVDDNLGDVDTFSDTYLGWTAGAGVEVGVTENVSLKAEYLYTDLGSRNDGSVLDDGVTDTDIGVTFHAIKAGVNFQF